MNAFLSTIEKFDLEKEVLERLSLTTLQVNLGDLCNQSCFHCHIEASPQGKKIMSIKVVDDIINFLKKYKIKTIDITGGAPELNPHFDYLVKSVRPHVEELIVRSNLTVIFEPGKEYLPDFFKKNNVHLVCSLPYYSKENVDRQRGRGVFEKSIKALHLLNSIGFGRQNQLILDLVYNPLGTNLTPQQASLEKEYKELLKENYGIEFNRILTITNAPIKKFKDYLKSNGNYQRYCSLLEDSFNPNAVENLMCRTFLSVDYDGRLYDCDFNLALGLALKDENDNFITIDKFNPGDLEGKEILTGEHCFSCTAGSGSSCQGALADTVKTYYGKILKSKNDLKTSACCSTETIPLKLREITKKIEPEILAKFYGCGSPLPPLLEGVTLLDLGCGTGRDVYLASYLAGEKGKIIGVDMIDEQLGVANKYEEIQMKRFGLKRCNVEFKKGYIEDLKDIGVVDNSMDVVISNCVINLSLDKKRVFAEIFRVLKPGGELYFSDIFAGRRIPEHLKNDPVLYGECLSGALYIEDFRRLLREIGCLDYRVVSQIKIELNDAEVMQKIGMIDFYSMTVRAFKLDDLEDICEDYGQVAVYLGTIPETPHQFILDDHHIFIAQKPMLVCGNTASMLENTRYAKHFKVRGNRNTHFGPFRYAPYKDRVDKMDSYKGGSCC